MKNSIRFWVSLFMVAGLSSLALLNCNLSDQGERYVLNVKLNDSLSADMGVFNSIDISIYDTNGTLVQAGVFHGAYNLKDSAEMHVLHLNAKPPDPFDIRITASKDSGESWVFTTRVANGVPGTAVAVHLGGPSGQKPVPTRIIITNPVLRTFAVGDPDITLAATVDPSDAPQDIVWSVSSLAIAEIQPGNKLRGIKPGPIVLTAAAKTAPTVFDTLILTIKAAPTSVPSSIRILTSSPLVLTVGGAALALSADVLPGDAAQGINWTLPITDIAVLEAGNKIRGLKAGSIKVTATSVVDGTVSSTLDVTVQDPPKDMPVAITPTQTALALVVGGPLTTLEARVTPPEASQAVIWTLEAPGVAEIVNDNQIRGLKAGVAKAIATSVVKSTVTASVAITVTVPVVDPESISLRMPVPMNLASNGALGDMIWAVLPTGSDQEVQWTSSNLNVAQITTGDKVKSFAPGKATITGKCKAKPSVSVAFDVVVINPVKMDSIIIKPSKFTLYTGGADTLVTVRMVGTDTGAKYSLSTSDPLVASVSSAGVVKGLKPGVALITAAVVGYSSVASVCSALVVTDPPIVTVTPDQAIAYGAEAVFNVSVTQAYGAVTDIKADMDGDNVFEQTVPGASQATFRQKYATVKTYSVAFKARDTEGNETTVTRKVTVGAPGAPTVQIVSPSKDTAINSRSIKIRFTVKDTAQKIDTAIDSTVTALVNGDNIIKVSRSNAGGEGSYQITVTVDVTPPAAPVFTAQAQNPTGNDRPTWKWSAVADAARYQVKFDSDTSKDMINVLAGTQYQPPAALADGVQTLYLRAIDAVGNVSAVVSQPVTIKTSLPATPVLVSAPAAVSSVRTPVWKWKTGDATKGNGKYKVWLNDVEQTLLTTPSYTATSLPDGSYILKVRELDDLGSESLDLAFAGIKVDGTKPVITVTGRTSGDLVTLTTTRSATIAGSIVDQGGSGTSTATWELSGGTTKTAVAIATPGSFSINTGSMTNGSSTTLTIKTTDGANNAAAFTLVFSVNVPAPTLAFVSPTPADGYVSNGPVTAYYQIDGGPTLDTVLNLAAPSSGETSTAMPLAITVTNEGGSATITRTFYRTHAAVRFFTATGTAGGDCNSWAKACKFEGNLSGGTGKYFWLQNGQYDMSGKAQPFNVSGVQLFGGIKANGKNILDRSGETVIFSNNSSTGTSYLANGAVVTKVTFSGDFSYQVFTFDPGSTIKFVECKFAAITANGASAYYGTLMGGSEVQLRFERCTFDNSAGNGALMVASKSSPYYNLFQDCTFIPGGSSFSNDFEGGSSDPTWLSYRFINPTGTPRMMLDGVCGLPGSPACPP